ncbi:MAG: YeiH family protein [Candidatus Eiseniibacteriota bacterium]
MSDAKPRPVNILPGLALAVMVGLAARIIHRALPPSAGSSLGEVIFAVLLGMLVGNIVRLPKGIEPGVRFSFQAVLRGAIVLLGASFSFHQVVAIGGKSLIMIAVLMALALSAAHLLGRLAGVPGRLATLIGVGTAVCGNSAIVAVAPVIRALDEEVSFAVATNTLFGTAAVLLYPIIGHALHFNDHVFGTWAGTAVNDTSQVVAAGFAYSEAAGRLATAVKLTRNALMGLVIVGVGLAYARAGAETGAASPLAQRLKQSIPLFVLGFLAMAILNSVGVFATLSRTLNLDLATIFRETSRAMILVALAGVGLSTRIDAMRRTGLKPFLIGLVVALITSGASLLLIRLIGPASA